MQQKPLNAKGRQRLHKARPAAANIEAQIDATLNEIADLGSCAKMTGPQ